MSKTIDAEGGFGLLESIISAAILAISIAGITGLVEYYQRQSVANLKLMSSRVIATGVSSRIYSSSNAFPKLAGTESIYFSCYTKVGVPSLVKNPKNGLLVNGFVSGIPRGENSQTLCSDASAFEVHVIPNRRADGKPGTSYLIVGFDIIRNLSNSERELKQIFQEKIVLGTSL